MRYAGGSGAPSIRKAAKQAQRREKVKAYVEQLREQQNGGGGGGGVLGTIMNPVAKTLEVLDAPRRGLLGTALYGGGWIDKEILGREKEGELAMQQGREAFAGKFRGEDYLRERWGVDTPNVPLLGDVGGFAFDVATDPLTYAAGAGILRGGAAKVSERLMGEGVERTTARILAERGLQEGAEKAAASGSEAALAAALRKQAREQAIKEVQPIAAKVAREGTSSLTKEELLRYLGTSGGARLIVPGTGRWGRKITHAAEEKTIPIIPKAVTDVVNRPAAHVRTTLRESGWGKSVARRLGGEEKMTALKELMRSGDTELFDVGRKGIHALQTEQSRAAATFRGLMDDYAKNVRPKIKTQLDDVIDAVERGDFSNKGAAALRDFFARVRKQAEEAGINLPDDPLYAPLIMTRDGRKARAEALGKGARGGYNPTAKSRLRALFGSDQARTEFEAYAKEKFGLSADFFERHPDKIIPTYLQALERRYADELVKNRLLDEGALTQAITKITDIDPAKLARQKKLREMLGVAGDRVQAASTKVDDIAAQQAETNASIAQRALSPVGGPPVASNPPDDLAALLQDSQVARDTLSGVTHAPFERMGVRQLRRYAKDQGITGADRMPRQELVDQLAARAAAGSLRPASVTEIDELMANIDKADADEILGVFPSLSSPSRRRELISSGLDDPEVVAARQVEDLVGTRNVSYMVRPAVDVDALETEVQTALKAVEDSDNALRAAVNKPDKLIDREVVRQNRERLRYLNAAQKQANAELRKVAVLEARRAQAEARFLREQSRMLRVEDQLSKLKLERTRTQINEQLFDGAHKLIDGWSGRMGRTELVDALNAVAKVSTSEGWAKVLHHYDTLLNYIKAWQISSPGFHMRNTFGGVFNNFLADIDPGAYNRYWRARMGLFSDDLDREAFRAWREFSSPGQFGSHEVATGVTGARLRDRLNPLTVDFYKRTANPLSSRNAYVHANQSVGAQVEDMLRGSLFIDVYKKTGGNVDEALDAVYKYHFNYDDLSVFEQRGMRRVFPFYTWTRKNLPLQIEMMIARPGKYAWWNHYSASVAADGDREGTVPQYFGDMWALPTGLRTNAGDQMYLSPDLPFTRTLSETIPWEDGKPSANPLLSQMTPILKTPIERIQGHQYFKNLPLLDTKTDTPDTWEKIPGFSGILRELGVVDKKGQISQDDAYTIEQYMPALARLRRLWPSEKKYEDRKTSTWLSFLGIPLRANTDAEKRAERYRQYLEKTDPMTIRVPKQKSR